MLHAHRGAREATAVAVAFLATAGVAGLVAGPYLVALGLWVIDQPATHGETVILVIDAILGGAAVATGLMALVAARGLWRGLDWAVPASLLVALVLLGAMAVVAMVDIWIPVYWLVVLLAALIACSALLVSILAPPAQRTERIGSVTAAEASPASAASPNRAG